MPEIPYIEVNESTEPIYTIPRGGRTIFVAGSTGATKDLTTLEEMITPGEAITALGPEGASNYLLAAILDLFDENKKRDASDQIGVEKVYAVNVGGSATAQDWADAAELSEEARDIEEELYILCADLAVMNANKTRLENLADAGQYRIAGYTHASGAAISAIALMTNTSETSYIRSPRIYLKHDRDMQGFFSGKLAHTEPTTDPGYRGYRAVTYADKASSILSDADAETLVSAGVIPDIRSIGYPTELEPALAVSTAYREVNGARPVDSELHIRRAVDWIWRQLDGIVARELKNNDTSTTLEAMREAGSAFLNQLQKESKIQDWDFDIIPDTSDANMVIVRRAVQPQNSIKKIREDSTIRAPV